MRTIQKLPINLIIVDRHSITPQTFDLAKKLSTGFTVPPIKVHRHGNKWILTDGRHRITAHKLCGMTEILCKFKT